MSLSIATPCPGCHGPMNVAGLICKKCDVTVNGPIEANEFVTLSKDLLQFARVFIWCEGNIREIEKSLGLSYPTVKARIQDLKKNLFKDEASTSQNLNASSNSIPATLTEILDSIEAGNQSPEQLIEQLKKGKKHGNKPNQR